MANLLIMARDTVQRPREGARRVMQANVPMAARWIALILMAVVSAVLAHVSFALLPVSAQAENAAVMPSPFVSAVMQGGLMLAAVVLIDALGRFMGGKGRFEDALILMVWLQFILLILQLVQIVTQVVAPPASLLVGYFSVTVFLWLLSHFVAELHGFSSVLKTFGGILLALLAVGFVLAFFFSASLGSAL
ncbi:MAG: YIP1 family protein [Rhodobacteraceae bacterium]|nr:YIP1 family protein [Paracoccaceae bacterium]